MKILKEEKGSITLFVLIAMLFFAMYLVGMYMLSASTEGSITKETARIKEIYEQGVNDIDDVYNTLEKRNKIEPNAPNITGFAQKTYVTWKLNEEKTEYEINDTQINEPLDEGYTIHPAFTNEGNGGFGELDGIWVAKFEASSNTTTPDTNYGGGNYTNLKVQVKPGVQSWRYITSKNIFTVCRKMTNTDEVLAGSTIDSHMMKNTEWGAVAILSQSKYGIFNSQSSTGAKGDATYQIWNNSNGYNNYQNIYTGYAGNNKDATTTSNSTTAPTNVYKYNTINGTKASTTGTVYGIYDMAGGSWEYVAGCLKGYENSKFGVTEGDSKYVDLYTNSSDYPLNYEGAKIGDAVKETKGWNNDDSFFVYSSYPVFERGRLLC